MSVGLGKAIKRSHSALELLCRLDGVLDAPLEKWRRLGRDDESESHCLDLPKLESTVRAKNLAQSWSRGVKDARARARASRAAPLVAGAHQGSDHPGAKAPARSGF